MIYVSTRQSRVLQMKRCNLYSHLNRALSFLLNKCEILERSQTIFKIHLFNLAFMKGNENVASAYGNY